jgi:hypothetical protein
VGDSISLQYGPYLEAGLRGVCRYARKQGEDEARIDLDTPRGANGGDSANVRSFLAGRAALPGCPHTDLLAVNCGLHDIKTDPETGDRAVEPGAYRGNLEAIVAVGHLLADVVIWIRTTPVDDAMHARRDAGFGRVQTDVDQYNRIADEVMAETQVPVIDLARLTEQLDLPSGKFADGVHFVPEVQRCQGAYLAGWVTGWLARG